MFSNSFKSIKHSLESFISPSNYRLVRQSEDVNLPTLNARHEESVGVLSQMKTIEVFIANIKSYNCRV